MRTFEVTVASVERLTPTFTRVTFEGESLRGLHRCGPLGPRDVRVKLLLAVDGSTTAPAPDFDRAHWQTEWRAQEESVRGVLRTYTIRRIHGTEQEPLVDIDFVLHPGGPAAAWAERARPGALMRIIGPNAASEWYGGIEWRPPTAPGTRVLLVGDETAAPAIGSILETLPEQYAGHVLLEVPTAQDFLSLPARTNLDVRLLARDGRPRGELALALLADLISGEDSQPHRRLPDVDVDHELLWEVPERGDTPFYAWVAGEAAMVRSIRRHLVQGRGVDRRAVAFMGYWREGRSETS